MNVYLDSNIIYSDPFFKQSYSHLTLELAQENIVNIYMSRVVYQESYNNYKKQIQEMMSDIKKLQAKEKFTKGSIDEYFEVKQDGISNYLKEFEEFYEELFAQGVITLIEYDNNILPELVSRSLQRVQPFTDKKQEFRDAIIWLS
ncbi:PIN domain-containing protein [Halobacillus sp. BBL2006]|uniref:PIN domain-containing protein n=1 Tax=Halobacillus sp. BBL2006 TaxID=1543706 RepID=UPI000541CF7A|nr:PIN domain-containing protein [Halobacillus sp. BBL2006]KHE72951.1 hypothetical protein LD39_01885 [Halobacillus sp. BBL2006]